MTRRSLLLPPVMRRSLLLLVLSALLALCAQAQAQNNAATGAPAITAANSADLTTVGPTEDSALTAAQGTIMDDDGITTFAPTWQWQQADAPTGSSTPTGSAYDAIAGATAATFTPLQEHVGKFLRVCAAFNDDADNRETRCRASVAAVVNAADSPVAQDNTVYVPVGRAYTFSADDFPFADEDGDALSRITIGSSVPARGALSLSGTTVAAGFAITLAQLDARLLTYTPPTDATAAMAGYASFNFKVRTGESGFNVKDSATRVMTIDLVTTVPSAASGAPTVTAVTGTAHNEDVELTATVAGVTDANGIPNAGRRWQWQSASAPATGAPAAGAYADIAGATAVTFTPGRANVGQYIRVCLRFTDGIGTAEGTFCSDGAIINHTPLSADASVSVSTTATAAKPYVFRVSDFPFRDTGGDRLSGITIVSTVEPGKGTLRFSSLEVTPRGIIIDRSSISRLTYYPPAGNGITSDFATFAFRVNDGKADSAIHTMTIHLGFLRLRLRLFLEGPLR